MERKRLGDLLLDTGLLTADQIEQALETKGRGERIGEALLREGHITEQQLIEVLEFQLGIPHIDVARYDIKEEAVQLVSKELAKRYQLMPINIENNKLLVAMADPMNYFAMEELRIATGFDIVPGIASKKAILRAISKHYELQESLDEVMGGMDTSDAGDVEEEFIQEDAPVVRLVNQIIENAAVQNASDIHFDPQEKELLVRYRVDGVLRTERRLPKHMQNVIIARIKIMGNLNITENRKPQDGRIQLIVNDKPVDIRLSALPAVFGEKMVLRILDMSNAQRSLSKLGFTPDNEEAFKNMIGKPNGVILITGPTGSGKSSTLYAALNKLNSEEVNIITVEDPVEYQLAGINQVHVNEDVGMSFANGLRSILRQDPDIVMVGEIRDSETANTAIRASLTGHLVLSTLHTNSAVATLTRLVDMGVEPFLITSSLTGVVAQRLVRRVCRDCGEYVEPTEREREIFHKQGKRIEKVYRGKGCPNCGKTGYKGRVAIHEILVINDEIRTLVMKNANAADIRNYAKEHGFQFLIDDGLMKVAEGATTTEEILRVVASE